MYAMTNGHISISGRQTGTNERGMTTEPCGIGNGA